jgi:hypothetical protein
MVSHYSIYSDSTLYNCFYNVTYGPIASARQRLDKHFPARQILGKQPVARYTLSNKVATIEDIHC